MPVTMGDSSPMVATTNASSTSRKPSSTRPCWSRARAWSSLASQTQVGIVETLADRGGLDRGAISGPEITAVHLLQPDRDQQIAALDAVLPGAVKEPLRACKPSAGAGGLPSKQEVVANPEGAPD